MKLGKKGKANQKNNRELKKIFTELNIDFCEVCGTRDGLTYAHSKKRRFITDDQSMKEVALLCLRHHIEIEALSHAEMYQKVTEIIERRNQNEFIQA